MTHMNCYLIHLPTFWSPRLFNSTQSIQNESPTPPLLWPVSTYPCGVRNPPGPVGAPPHLHLQRASAHQLLIDQLNVNTVAFKKANDLLGQRPNSVCMLIISCDNTKACHKITESSAAGESKRFFKSRKNHHSLYNNCLNCFSNSL